MIKKLRLKFIAVSMLSILFVLFIIITAINLLNYKQVVQDADAILTLLESNNGVFPKEDKMPKPKGDFDEKISPEAPFDSRYFSVLLNSNGTAASVDTGKIASIDTQEAISYAKQAQAASAKKGFLADYRYIKQDTDDGSRIIFLYCEKSLSNFRLFLWISMLISALGLFTVFILVVFLSKRIIKPVAESYEKQKQFITDAGHEIKTPLTIIDADISILELEQGENEWLSDIQLQTRRLANLTNDLICLSRMEEAKGSLFMIDFPISDVVSETVQSFQGPAKVQGKQFDIQIEPMLTYNGDEKSIRQLVSILLDNALKYSKLHGHISVSLEKKGSGVQLKVHNTVESISKNSLPYLFDRFYRGDKSRNSAVGGYGIGLSLAKAIVAAHKGKITAWSKDEKSLTISVVL